MSRQIMRILMMLSMPLYRDTATYNKINYYHYNYYTTLATTTTTTTTTCTLVAAVTTPFLLFTYFHYQY